MKVLQESKKIENVRYSLSFVFPYSLGAGWNPPCDRDGNLIDDCIGNCAMGDPQKHVKYFEDGLAEINMFGTFQGEKVEYQGIEEYRWSYWQPKVIECEQYIWNPSKRDSEYCGAEVTLDNTLYNTCEKCGTDYSISGSRLAPREQWGWDTGETFSDIATANYNVNDFRGDFGRDDDY